MKESMLVEPGELAAASDRVLFDCRFSLPQPDAGREAYLRGHIPGAHYLDLNRDLSGPVARRGGRHPLPAPETFAATLARFGVDRDTRVIAYDDSRFAFASRLWWMMRSLGFRPPQLLNGGYGGWLATGGQPQTAVPEAVATAPAAVDDYSGYCDHKGLRLAQGRGALVVDSREERRFLGLEEPIDPVAGHIPGAINRPWQSITAESGRLRTVEELREHWADVVAAGEAVVYCGSGVTACANLFSLALLDRDATLYAGSWSDWCSRL